MQSTTDKPRVFLSYSHQDGAWRDRLVAHLGILEEVGVLEAWADRRISAGDRWDEIREAFETASVAILMISADFLASSYIISAEMPRLLQRSAEDGLVIVPVILRSCAWQSVSWLRELQVLPRDGKPLASLPPSELDEALASIAIEIASIVEASSVQPKSRRLGRGDDLQRAGEETVFVCHCEEDGDFSLLVKSEIEKEGFGAWVDTDRLTVGVNWREEIDQAIRSSIALVVVMTSEARRSEYVTYEWSFALGVGVPVIPVLLRQTQLHPRLEALQYLDFTNRRARPWEDLIESLKGASSKGRSSSPNQSVAADGWRRR